MLSNYFGAIFRRENQYICGMKKAEKSPKQTEKQFTKEYNELMSTGTFNIDRFQEWSQKATKSKSSHCTKITLL